MKKIGFFGGTFDPIHFGHINLAFEMLEKHKLDEIWFCPAFISPHKLNQNPFASSHHRLQMIKAVISPISSFKLLDLEIIRERPSYTIETLEYLFNTQKNCQIYLIIGEDATTSFFQWYKVEDIVKQVPVLVGSRLVSIDKSLLEGSQSLCEVLKKGWTRTRIMEISSTEVRERLMKRLNCEHLVPYETLCYIYKNELYYKPRNLN